MDSEATSQFKLQWSAPEYEERPRTRDWFWALGIVIAAVSIASIIFGNYFFAALIIISGGIFALFAIKKPEIVPYELNERGFQVRSRLYPYESIHAFWIEKGGQPLLFIKSSRPFLPIVVAPIHPDDVEHISAVMIEKNIPVEEMREHVSEKILEVLGL